MLKFKFKKSAFTLVELIIVVSIIAVLASLAFMALSGETAQARDAKRQADLTTFENAIATANSKNKKINYVETGVQQDKVITNNGDIYPLRGAYLVEIEEDLFSTDIIATMPRDPKGAKYLGAFLSSTDYQLLATKENPATKIETALVKGSFKSGAILDVLMEDIDEVDTIFKVANPQRFVAGDKITIDKEEMVVVSFNTTNNELKVTRGSPANVHNKQTMIKIKEAVSGADGLSCVGELVNNDWDTVMTGTEATGFKCKTTIVNKGVIINEGTILPYVVSLNRDETTNSSSSSSSGAPVATCADGIQNQTETGIDCGGTCSACATCADGIQNQTETGIDCGGTCSACATCADGIQNQDEIITDCGGVCPSCGTCSDTIKNQNEIRVDCGGICPACPIINTREVGPGKTYATINSAIAAATTGDIIAIYPGTYPENVILNKFVHLKGITDHPENSEVLINPASGMGINVNFSKASSDPLYIEGVAVVSPQYSLYVQNANSPPVIINKSRLEVSSTSYSSYVQNLSLVNKVILKNIYLDKGTSHITSATDKLDIVKCQHDSTWASGVNANIVDVVSTDTVKYGPAYGDFLLNLDGTTNPINYTNSTNSIANVITVGVNKDYLSINTAIKIANENNIIAIYPGTYPENVILNKFVHLKGITDHPENSEVLINPVSGMGINVNFSKASSDPLYIEGVAIVSPQYSIYVQNATSPPIIINKSKLEVSSASYSSYVQNLSLTNKVILKNNYLDKGSSHIMSATDKLDIVKCQHDSTWSSSSTANIVDVTGVITNKYGPAYGDFLLNLDGTANSIDYTNSGASPSPEGTITVGENKDYLSINTAIKIADNGNIIAIYPGTYPENIIINKFVHLRGVTDHPENSEVLINPASGMGVIVNFTTGGTGSLYIEGIAVTSPFYAMYAQNSPIPLIINKSKFKATNISYYSYLQAGTITQSVTLKNNYIEKGGGHFNGANNKLNIISCELDSNLVISGTPNSINIVNTPTSGYGPAYGSFYQTAP